MEFKRPFSSLSYKIFIEGIVVIIIIIIKKRLQILVHICFVKLSMTEKQNNLNKFS